MKDFLNTNIGLSFALIILMLAAGVENKMFDDFDHQVGDKAADFFRQTFGQEPEKQTEGQEAADESPITE
jgi:choline-glycine betaine transporter